MQSFSEKVYTIVRKIPQGSVLSYGEVAKLAGSPKAARAVGTAMARNENWPSIPCHRVVSSDGRVGRWSGRGGSSKKISLLKKEGHDIEKFKLIQ